ncbi:MAG: hypothetical protein JWO89_1122, partial [Verrucomicrobiaceae bacterium]|nr:hypothetical protein [Verrucomicrobiaceae bacterium]
MHILASAIETRKDFFHTPAPRLVTASVPVNVSCHSPREKTAGDVLNRYAMDQDHMKPTARCHFSLPEEMPVMVLTDCFLFPGCFLPLFI